jgi:hypothetical protein
MNVRAAFETSLIAFLPLAGRIRDQGCTFADPTHAPPSVCRRTHGCKRFITKPIVRNLRSRLRDEYGEFSPVIGTIYWKKSQLENWPLAQHSERLNVFIHFGIKPY